MTERNTAPHRWWKSRVGRQPEKWHRVGAIPGHPEGTVWEWGSWCDLNPQPFALPDDLPSDPPPNEKVCLKCQRMNAPAWEATQPWHQSYRADPWARAVADRHYNRQSPDSPQFVPPGRCLVLTAPGPCLWVTSWPFAEYTKHAWAGAWVCSAFRRENDGGGYLASDLIRAAVAATRWRWPDVPDLGMITFVDRRKVKPVAVRGEPTWGRTYLLAGFEVAGETQGGLLALRLPLDRMPEPMAPIGSQVSLFGVAA